MLFFLFKIFLLSICGYSLQRKRRRRKSQTVYNEYKTELLMLEHCFPLLLFTKQTKKKNKKRKINFALGIYTIILSRCTKESKQGVESQFQAGSFVQSAENLPKICQGRAGPPIIFLVNFMYAIGVQNIIMTCDGMVQPFPRLHLMTHYTGLFMIN